MGINLNPDNIDFQEALNAEIYVDKTELIKHTNKKIRTTNKYICVSRPRRFGKSMAADMLVAYYSRGCDSKDMFEKYKITEDESFENPSFADMSVRIFFTPFEIPEHISLIKMRKFY